MEANAGMVAGSHKRNEFVMIRHEGEVAPKQLKNMNTQLCQICGDTIGLTALGDVFVACNECAFPVCRPCYEYKRKDGNRSCPQCKTRYKRHKGSPRVEGDDEKDDVDDLENEFNYANGNGKATLHWHVQGEDIDSSIHNSQHPIQLLTNGQLGASTRAGEIAKECNGQFRIVRKEPRWSDPHCEQRAVMVSSATLD